MSAATIGALKAARVAALLRTACGRPDRKSTAMASLLTAAVGGGLIAWASRATPGLARTRRERIAFVTGIALATGGAVTGGLWI
jgi:hypothetical protein